MPAFGRTGDALVFGELTIRQEKIMTVRSIVCMQALCFAALMTLGSARAQMDQPPEDTDAIRLSVEVRGSYTDNRDSSETDEESNFDLYLAPRIDVVADLVRTKLDAYYQPYYRYRTDPSDIQNEDEFYHSLGLNMDHEFTEQSKIRLWEKFDLTDDPAVEEGAITIRGDRSYIMNRFEGAFNHAFSRWTYTELSGSHMLKRYDEQEVADESDEDAMSVGARLWRQIAPSVGIDFDVRTTSYGFESAMGIERDFDVLLAGAGIEKVFNPNLRGSVRAGWQRAEYDDDALDTQNEPYLSAELRGQTAPTARLIASVTHGIRDADAYPFASQSYTDARGRLELDATPKLMLGFQGTYRLSEYEKDSRPSTAAVASFPKATSGDETTIVLQGDAAFKLTDRSSLKFIQRLEDIDSDVGESFTKNTSIAVATMAF